MLLRNDPNAVPPLTITLDGGVVELERLSSNVLAIQSGMPHSSANSLADQVAIEFGDRADEDCEAGTLWTACVNPLSQTAKLNAESVEYVEYLQEVIRRARDAIA